MTCSAARSFRSCPLCSAELERIGREFFCSKDCGWLPVIIEFDNASTTDLASRPSVVNASVSSSSMLAISHGVGDESVTQSGQK